MKSQIKKYTKDVPLASKNKLQPAGDGQTVLLTGSMGQLGSYLLDFMCCSPRVSKVICLNRTDDGHSRQQCVSAEGGLGTDFEKVKFHNADLGAIRPRLDSTST